MGYKKYIKDYRKEYIVKPNGKPGVTATYIGKYFRFTASERDFNKARLVFAALSALALVSCILPLLFDTESSHNLYVSLPQVVSLFPIVHLIIGVANLYMKKPPLIREFRDKTEGRVSFNSAAAGSALALVTCMRLLFCILNGFSLQEIIFAVITAVGSASGWYIYAKRSFLATEEIPNPNAEDGEEAEE